MLLAQLMGGPDGENDIKPPHDPSITFLSPNVCKNALVWVCPSEHLTVSSNRSHTGSRCHGDHNPYFKKQYLEAMEIYRSERLKSDPTWDGIFGGDPW